MMSEAEVVRDYTRVAPCEEGVALECAVIAWPHPAMPEMRWVRVGTLEPGVTEAEVKRARLALLKDPRWFGRCRHCQAWQVKGHMHEPDVCQGCAQGELGVLY